ncbi:MAG: hypothetical protein ACK5LC_12000 [Coprobacillaceae bacterium]
MDNVKKTRILQEKLLYIEKGATVVSQNIKNKKIDVDIEFEGKEYKFTLMPDKIEVKIKSVGRFDYVALKVFENFFRDLRDNLFKEEN